eukprot:snap_masked-scaffold_2-processed-gene-23.38-mRNA-1 protein AED:1.00 eAED:1.00 QI:0/-1/0/0/-1/1/1/0/255
MKGAWKRLKRLFGACLPSAGNLAIPVQEGCEGKLREAEGIVCFELLVGQKEEDDEITTCPTTKPSYISQHGECIQKNSSGDRNVNRIVGIDGEIVVAETSSVEVEPNSKENLIETQHIPSYLLDFIENNSLDRIIVPVTGTQNSIGFSTNFTRSPQFSKDTNIFSKTETNIESQMEEEDLGEFNFLKDVLPSNTRVNEVDSIPDSDDSETIFSDDSLSLDNTIFRTERSYEAELSEVSSLDSYFFENDKENFRFN